MKAFKKLIWRFLNYVGLGGSLQLYLQSGLKEDGWFKSFHSKKSINQKGDALPWYNYTFIKFLTPRLTSDLQIFEYGAGNSTIWYAQKVKFIKAVENDAHWVAFLQTRLPKNAEVVFKSLNNQAYQNEIKIGFSLSDQVKPTYDIVVVDGRRRNDCVMMSVDYLSEKGVLILDNSERTDYQPAKDFMKEKGFKSLDFEGIAPITAHNTCTTIFYRPNNCLDI